MKKADKETYLAYRIKKVLEYVLSIREINKPEIQGRRIDAHIILGKSIKEIAEAEGVHEESVRQSIKRGLERMKKTF